MSKSKMKTKKLTYAQAFARSGGKARAAKLTAERRSEIARTAIAARWAKVKGGAA